MFTGSCVALVTPMKNNGDVDYQTLSKLVEWHISEGTSALAVVGTTGESATLTQDELCQVIGCALEVTQKRIPVIAGTGTHCTQMTIEKTMQAEKLGCDGALIVTPYYNKPTQEGLYQHYAAISAAVRLPIILYNVPSRTSCDLLPETAVKLSKLNNIVGIKEATGDLNRVAMLTELCDLPFKLYSGDDATAMDFMIQGGHGVISVAANVVPHQVQQLCDLVFKEDLGAARALNNQLKHLYKKLFVESNPIPVKWALQAMGKIEEGIRLPLTPLSETYQGEVKEVLKQVGADHA